MKVEIFDEPMTVVGNTVVAVLRGIHMKRMILGKEYEPEAYRKLFADPPTINMVFYRRNDFLIRRGLSHITTNLNLITGEADTYIMNTVSGIQYLDMLRAGVELITVPELEAVPDGKGGIVDGTLFLKGFSLELLNPFISLDL